MRHRIAVEENLFDVVFDELTDFHTDSNVDSVAELKGEGSAASIASGIITILPCPYPGDNC